ncbi:MAG: DnaJ C-terminal domain-containing protein, partial [Pseudomonadota bacterium]|nr:DnaJ C-terminal domain-containing protein [Pseudomonadota bacterium]
GSGAAGDLYLQVELAAHPRYRLVGNDLEMDLPVTPWEAALGAKVTVPTLGGRVDLTVPAGTQSGSRLRLKGRGIGGDLLAVVKIMTPRATTDAQRELYRRMAREMPMNPRAAFENG